MSDWYHRVVDQMPDGVMVVGFDGTVLDANPAVLSLVDRSRGELVGQHVDVLHDEDGKRHFAAHLADLRRGRTNPSDVDALWYRPDGTPVWTIIRETLFDSDDPERRAVLWSISDNRRRKELLDELRATQRRQTQAERSARLGSWEMDRAGDIVASEGLYALYGEETVERFATHEGYLSCVHPDDRARVRAIHEGAERDEHGEHHFDYEARIRSAQGYLWIRAHGVTQVDDTGEAVCARATHHDVTRARASDDALQDLVTQNSLMQAVASAANEATSLAEFLARGKELVLLHDDWERAVAFMPRPGRPGETTALTGWMHESGQLVELSDRPDPGTPEAREWATADRAYREKRSVWDDERLTISFPVIVGGDVVTVIAITSRPPLIRHDLIEQMCTQAAVQIARVAEREHNDRELAKARDRAMQASRHKSEFLATMSHEIRTPLNGIVGLSELLAQTDLDDRQRHLLGGVDLSSRSLLAIVNDILDFSKIEAGRLELEELDYDVREVLDQAVGLLADGARAKGLELSFWCSPDVPAVTRGDPTRLLQVVTNFGSNAIKFTSAGAIEIRATQVGSDEEPARLRVEVKDTGIGISKERLAVVFRAFSQADVSTTRRFGGTGLGLAISREIVEAKGGDIGCVSELGEGSTFWLEIPLVASESGQAQLSIARMREQLSGLRVLAVDDVDTNRQILCEQLAWWHVECDAVESARAAIERLESHRYDAIILDMAMPEIDGLTLATMLRRREDTREIPMVLLTSQLPPDEATLASHGIDQCLVKPVSSAVIRDCLLRLTPGPVEEPSAQPRPLERRSDRRILVVEDNQVNRIVASGFLEALGYDHDLAVDGVEALEMLERRSYDLVLMDLQMPRLDGLSATEALREREGDGRRTPVVAMTAAAVESERDRAFAAGMDDFVTKPVNRARLGEVLSQWLSTGSTPPIEGTGQVVLTGALNVARLEELRELTPDGSYVRRAGTNFNLRVPALVDAVIGAEDGQALEAAAHTLSGSASNLGLDRVAAIAQALESAGRANELADPLLITELERSVAEATVALDDYLSELAAG